MALVYPANLYDSDSNYIIFTARDKDGASLSSIALYSPPALAFSDGAGYSTFDMGPIGATIVAGVEGGLGADDLKNMASAATGSTELKTILAAKALQNAAVIPGADRAADSYQQSKSIAMNPNTVTAFSNMNIRSYVFNFKLVAENQNESIQIKGIQNAFREFMYADTDGAQGYILKYPAKWDISFKRGGTSDDNPFLPRIFESYLTNLQTTMNSSSHLTHADGSPTEVDLSITFQETRVLTQNDIRGLL
jgi:hypothetical protein